MIFNPRVKLNIQNYICCLADGDTSDARHFPGSERLYRGVMSYRAVYCGKQLQTFRREVLLLSSWYKYELGE